MSRKTDAPDQPEPATATAASPEPAPKERHLSVKVAPALFSRVQVHAHMLGKTASEVIADLIDAGVPVYEARKV